ncbi:MAG TPA: DivIVA domain-containing protein, partial [Acidimicrobiales bacterium]|nr:DivIVA domain-containing protein [Acidimicrobiales bacterium]
MPTERVQSRHVDPPDVPAELIAGRRFAQAWRGYAPEEVKQFLAQVAAQVRSLRERLEAETTARREAEQRASHPRMDEATLMAAVGEETAEILRSARNAAAEMTAKAEARASEILHAAETESADLVARAEALLAARSAEAETAAAEIRASAEGEAEELRELARKEAEALADGAAEEHRKTVEAAHGTREKILTDLARRRKLATVQIEQLRAGRERLLDAYLVVRRTLDEVTDELQRADAEARAAAEAVGAGAETSGGARDSAGTDPLVAFPESKPTAPVVLAPKASQVVAHAQQVAGDAKPAARTGDPAVLGARGEAMESVRILRPVATPTEPPVTSEPSVTIRVASVEQARPKVAAGLPESDLASAQRSEVDGLFARIRAGRELAARHARKALFAEAAPAEEPAGSPPVIPAAAVLEEDDVEDLLKRRGQLVGQLETTLARKLKRVLQDEQNSLLDRLRSAKGSLADLLPRVEEHPDGFVDAGRSVLVEAAVAGGRLVSAEGEHAEPPSVEDLAEDLGRAIAEP